MSITFGVLTLLILCASAFISLKNNERIEFEIQEKNTSLRHRKIQEDELAANDARIAVLKKEIPEIQEETRILLEEEAELQVINAKLKSDVETKTRKIDSNDKEYQETRETLLLVGEPNELVDKFKDMRVLFQELEVLIANKTSKEANLMAENTAAADLGARLKENLDIIGRGESLPTLKTRIRHIYPNWGFVTLANGYQSGVTGGSSLDIMRDGNVIGKLLVSTVERSSASASIVPDSIAEDITLRVGDQVVATPKK